MSDAIVVEGLAKTYPNGMLALRGIDIRVPAGTVFALLGPNGAGKSTTVKILTTLSRPTGGRAEVWGYDVVKQADQVRRHIGVVGQASGADPQLTGRENLRLQGRLYGLRGRMLRRRADELLERFGLSDAAQRVVEGYSGGMQRRLDIAMSLIHTPDVLFLDEPTTGLDPEVRTEMWHEIARLAREQGLTVLLTTHYLEEADQLSDQIAIVDQGQVVVEGTAAALKSELEGDALYIELASDESTGRLQPLIGGLDGVREVSVNGSLLQARVDNGAAAVPRVLHALDTRGLAVSSVRVATPTLDDVYLRYTGRRFEAAPESAEPLREVAR